MAAAAVAAVAATEEAAAVGEAAAAGESAAVGEAAAVAAAACTASEYASSAVLWGQPTPGFQQRAVSGQVTATVRTRSAPGAQPGAKSGLKCNGSYHRGLGLAPIGDSIAGSQRNYASGFQSWLREK